jgi:transcriptional regulator with XRE-family HTH domain
MTTLGDRIGNTRVSLGLTQHALAQKVGVLRSNVCSWEKNSYVPKEDILVALAEALGVSLLYLKSGEKS